MGDRDAAIALFNQATALATRGRHYEALVRFEEVLDAPGVDQLLDLTTRRLRAQVLNKLSWLEAAANEARSVFEDAAAWLGSDATLSPELRNRLIEEQLAATYTHAAVEMELEHYEAARDQLSAIAETIKMAGGAHEHHLTKVLLLRGQAHRDLGDFQPALLDLDLAFEKNPPDARDDAFRIESVRASVFIAMGRHDEVALFLKSSIDGALHLEDFESATKRSWLLARALATGGRRDEASAHLSAAERYADQCETPKTKAEVHEEAANLAHQFPGLGDELRHLRASWQYWLACVERQQDPTIRTEVASQAFDVARRAVVRLGEAGAHEQAWQLWEESRAAGLRARLRQSKVSEETTLSSIATLAETKSWLARRAKHTLTSLGALTYSPGTLALLVLNPDGSLSFKAADCPPRRLSSLVSRYNDAVDQDEPYALLGPIEEFRTLLLPLFVDLPANTQQVVIMPTANFWVAPWAAILDDYATSIAPSHSWLLAQPTQPDALNKAHVLSVGFGTSHDVSFADECRALRDAVKDVDIVVEDAATIDTVRTALRTDSIVHISAHGIPDTKEPADVGIELADGEFTASVVGTELVSSPLIVLSACESARLFSAPNDDAAGLVPALVSAGACSVIATLWPVEACAATAFVIALFRELRSGASIASAVASARLQLKNANFDPVAWATFQHYGAG